MDYVADRQAFALTAVVTLPDTRPDRSVTRLMQAARALRDAVKDLSRVEITLPAWRVVENGIRLLTPLPTRLRAVVSRERTRTEKHQQRSRRRDQGVER